MPVSGSAKKPTGCEPIATAACQVAALVVRAAGEQRAQARGDVSVREDREQVTAGRTSTWPEKSMAVGAGWWMVTAADQCSPWSVVRENFSALAMGGV